MHGKNTMRPSLQFRTNVQKTLWSTLLVVLAACTLSRTDSSPQAVQAKLADYLANAQNAQMTAAELWERLIAGETVSCQEAIPVPPPLALDKRDRQASPIAPTIANALTNARQAIQTAAELWQGVCTTPEAVVPLETARAARQAIQTADTALQQAAALLAAW